jgi:hypothetical protein
VQTVAGVPTRALAEAEQSMTPKPRVVEMPPRRPEASRPACVRVRGVRCRECGDYLSTAHGVRGVRGAFCGYCCPVCRRNPPLHEGDHAA